MSARMLSLLHRLREAQVFVWLGHRWWAASAMILAVSLVPSDAVRWVIIPPYAVVLYANVMHGDRPCLECVARWPLNPSEKAARWRRWLWVRHYGVWLYGAFYAAACLVTWMFHLHDLLLPVLLVIFTVVSYSKMLHDQVALWCPYCRRGRGWDDSGDGGPPPDGDDPVKLSPPVVLDIASRRPRPRASTASKHVGATLPGGRRMIGSERTARPSPRSTELWASTTPAAPGSPGPTSPSPLTPTRTRSSSSASS